MIPLLPLNNPVNYSILFLFAAAAAASRSNIWPGIMAQKRHSAAAIKQETIDPIELLDDLRPAVEPIHLSCSSPPVFMRCKIHL